MPTHRTYLKTTFKWLTLVAVFLSASVVLFSYLVYRQLEEQLPDVKQLHHVQYQIPLSIFTADHQLIARFGEKNAFRLMPRISLASKSMPSLPPKTTVFMSTPASTIKAFCAP
nr:hypothetical protein [Methylomarinum sp. Ch1-1]MDP4522134.1 hypothetical protein [Methylomarinum sp. Ch1-1]